MHNLFDFPPELVERIFEAIACSRQFKRVMRLRLVSRQFKQFLDSAICRLRLLDDIPEITRITWVDPTYRHTHWHNFILQYLAYQAWYEKNDKSLLGRIRHAAHSLSAPDSTVHEGDRAQTQIMSRIKSLCRLALGHPTWMVNKAALFQSAALEEHGCSDAELEADICVAAVYLGDRAYVEKLIAEGYHFCSWGEVKDICSGVFGGAFGAATLAGDIPMLRLLLSSNPNYKASEAPPSYLRRHLLYGAAVYGHKDAFDFALDGPLDLIGGEYEDSRRFPEYECLRDAIGLTRFPENYERGAAMFIPNSKIFDPRGTGSLEARLTSKAAAGHVEMVKYFLDQGVSPNQDAGKSGNQVYQPLLQAIYAGNPDVVELLLSHGADPNWYTSIDTALMAATRVSAISIVKMLLDAGAKVDEGCPPPVVVAVFKEDMEIFRLLRAHKATLDTPETGGWAMAVAQWYGLESMVEVLVQEGVQRDAILQRCAGRKEEYQPWYLFPQTGIDEEAAWLDAMYYD